MRKLTKLWLSAGMFFLGNLLFAQGTIEGLVLDGNKEAIIGANVLLLNATDSSFVRGDITDGSGHYIFEKITNGSYFISTTMVGYNSFYTPTFNMTENADLRMDPIRLEGGVTLSEVKVIGKKVPYEAKIDRLVINIENSVLSSSSTALEILERSPGVVVNRQNNTISLVGKNGVNVMINGKRSFMPVSSLVQFLEGMSAANIKSIELITVPPANFDAEGDGGYINIVLKKRTDEGLNGSFSASYGYGKGSVSNDNIDLNYRKGKLNLFGNYSFVLNGQEQYFITDRTITEGNNVDQSLTSLLRNPTQRNHNLRFGIDYQVSDKTIIGTLFSGYDNKWSMEALNTNQILNNYGLAAVNVIENIERNQWQHYSANFNVKHNFTEREFVSFDVDYLDFYNENPTDYINTVFNGSHTFLRNEFTKSSKTTPIGMLVGKMDYHRTFNDNFKLDMGIKGVRSSFQNRVLVQTMEGGNWQTDPSLTSNSELVEQILAAYASSAIQLGKQTTAKIGLRYEYTDSKLDTDSDGRVIDRQFGKFFPSAYLSHNFSETFGANLSYSRRITRPTFNEMAPFVFLVDPTTFFAGNVSIQPSFTDAFKMDLRYKSIFFSVQYSFQDSTIARFQQQYDPETNRLLLLTQNLKDSKVLSFTVGFPVKLTNWWEMRTNAIYFQQENNSYIQGEPIQLKKDYVQFNSTQSLTLPKGFSSEISFFYIGPRISGTLQFGQMYGLSIGMQKNLGAKWGTLRLNVTDVLNSVKLKGMANVEAQHLSYNGIFDFSQRTFSLTYSRNFGNQKLKSTRNRERGAAEESQRVN
ncbi:MAG: TonB dependent receptor [Saprospiraceae bacterium]